MASGSGNLLNNISNVLGQQFLTGQNKLNTLDISKDGHIQKDGLLGDFAKQVDQTADRSYTEQGYFRTHYNNPQPKLRDIVMQDPELTLIVKKKSFASLAENFRPELM